MKIKSFKGRSLDKLYEAISNELGPDAVVVCSDRPKGLNRFLPGQKYELIAVVDDATADSRMLSNAASNEELTKLSTLQEEKWKVSEALMSEMTRSINSISKRIISPTDPELPDYTIDWDPRFTKLVLSRVPGIKKGLPPEKVSADLTSMLNIQENFPVRRKRPDEKPHIIILAGPTGSGKTTTLAKLAADWNITKGLKVGMITTDTYRIAAVDQTREYATLLGLELKVAFSAQETLRSVQYFADRDVILVDTPGRNFNDKVAMSALRGMFSGLGPVTVLLLVPATLARNSIGDLIRGFECLGPDYVIATKVDEASNFSVFTTIACETTCPVAFLTNGQRVPQDIYTAGASHIADGLVYGTGMPEACGNNPHDVM